MADCQDSPAAEDLPGPNSKDEDRRQAGALTVSLSSYVSTASLAVLAGAFAIFTYVSQNFELSWPFYASITLTAASVVLSIFAGGKGSAWVIERLANGEWTPKPRNRCYNRQAVLTLSALFLLALATILGVSSPRRPAQERGEADRRTWLEHVTASSDYRIAALEEQRGRPFSGPAAANLEHHLEIQEAVHSRQCAELAILFPATAGRPPCRARGEATPP